MRHIQRLRNQPILSRCHGKRLLRTLRDGIAVTVGNIGGDRRLSRMDLLIDDPGLNSHRGLISARRRMHKDPAQLRGMYIGKTLQPCMAVDPRTLIEPSFILAGIYADHYRILAPERNKIRDIISGAPITTEMSAQVTIVDPHL